MKTLIASTSIGVTLVLLAPSAVAGPEQGVRCPSGFDALISDNNRKLVCRRIVQFERDAFCLPAYNLTDNGAKPDTCIVKVANTGLQHTVAPTALPIGNMPWHKIVSELKQVARPGLPDRFVATAHEFKFPELGDLYVGNPEHGVSCPTGYDGDRTFDGRGIRCDKLDGPAKSADCDGIVGWEWKLDLDGAEDRCRNVVTGETGRTKPTGMTKVQHDLERASNDVGWVLNKRPGARDTWQRKVYRFPIQ